MLPFRRGSALLARVCRIRPGSARGRIPGTRFFRSARASSSSSLEIFWPSPMPIWLKSRSSWIVDKVQQQGADWIGAFQDDVVDESRCADSALNVRHFCCGNLDFFYKSRNRMTATICAFYSPARLVYEGKLKRIIRSRRTVIVSTGKTTSRSRASIYYTVVRRRVR